MEGTKASLVENADDGGGLHNNHRSRGGVGFLAGLRTMIFGARDPESDLSVETLEELHMVTGCESSSAYKQAWCVRHAVSYGTLRTATPSV